MIEGLKRVLDQRLSPVDARGKVIKQDWAIGECLNRWFRPQFANTMVYIVTSSSRIIEKTKNVAEGKRTCVVSLFARTYHETERRALPLPCPLAPIQNLLYPEKHEIDRRTDL